MNIPTIMRIYLLYYTYHTYHRTNHYTYYYTYQMWANVAEGPRGCLAKHSAQARPLGRAPQNRGDAQNYYTIPTITIISTITRIILT